LNAVEALDREDIDPGRRREYRELVARGLARIGDTVNRLRRFTPRDAPLEPVDLVEVVRDSIELVHHRASRLGVAIGWSPPLSDVSSVIDGARNEIGQAVLNLLANALDALEESGDAREGGGLIDVAFVTGEGEVGIRVRDNGPGVEPGQLPKVSDLFYTTKEVGKGTGLGLSLVHNTVRKHEGRIAITSEPGEFFCVEIWFPVDRAKGE